MVWNDTVAGCWASVFPGQTSQHLLLRKKATVGPHLSSFLSSHAFLAATSNTELSKDEDMFRGGQRYTPHSPLPLVSIAEEEACV